MADAWAHRRHEMLYSANYCYKDLQAMSAPWTSHTTAEPPLSG